MDKNDSHFPEWTYATIVNSGYHDDSGGWEEVFDYGGVRYHALLWPSQDGTGLQDAMLTSLARACEANDDTMDDYADECRTLIWPLIEQDYASRPESQKTELGPQKKVIRIEGRTINGVLKAFKHKRVLDDTFHPIPNTFPGVPTFPESLVKRVAKIDTEIFKVEYEGQVYCLKTVHAKGGESALTREISILQGCQHPHIIPLRGVVINEQGHVEGILLEYIPHAITLRDFDGPFDDQQAQVWVSQFQSAMEYLHSRGMVWGDAKPDNILVRRNVDGDGDLVLVDFAGGATDGWVDWKVMESLAGDLMASPKIEKFMLEKGKGSERK
jgi:serine/threonine protein kinase